MSSIRAFWLILALASCGGSSSTGPPSPPPAPPPPPPQPPPPPPPPPGPSANVSMTTGNAFDPPTVTITVAGMVTWTNNAGIDHNVTFTQATGAPTNVPNFSTGSASRTFAAAGTFSYQCTLHGGMNGAVIVQ